MRFYSYYSLPLFVLCLVAQKALALTNVAAVIESPPVAPGLAFPVTVTTNEDGVVAHHFSMKPVITNMVAATNDLAELKVQQETIEAELKKVTDDGGALRKSMRSDYLEIVGVMTNFAARDPEGKKLHERIQVLEAELKTLRGEFQQKLDADAAYKQAMGKVEADRDSMKKFEKAIGELRKKRTDIGAKVWQLQTMVNQTLKAEEDERKAKEVKAVKDNKASAP